MRRLYPAAYADDAEKEDEYRRLTHEELRCARLANVDAVEASIDAELLSEEQLTAWMQAINSLRLVLGTLLDITDDDQELAFDPDDPEARTQALYGYLGGLLDEIVDAQLEALQARDTGEPIARASRVGVFARDDGQHARRRRGSRRRR